MIVFRKDRHGMYRAKHAGRDIFVCRTDPKYFDKMSQDYTWSYGVKSMMFGDDIIMGYASSQKGAKERIISYMERTLQYA